MIPSIHGEKFIEKSKELFNLLIDTSEEVENEKFKERVEKAFIIIGNFVFFFLCMLIMFWITGILFSMLPEWIQQIIRNLFDVSDINHWRNIFLLGFYLVLAILSVSALLLKIRKYIRIYNLAKFYTYIEIGNLLLRGEKPIFKSLMEAVEKTFS